MACFAGKAHVCALLSLALRVASLACKAWAASLLRWKQGSRAQHQAQDLETLCIIHSSEQGFFVVANI